MNTGAGKRTGHNIEEADSLCSFFPRFPIFGYSHNHILQVTAAVSVQISSLSPSLPGIPIPSYGFPPPECRILVSFPTHSCLYPQKRLLQIFRSALSVVAGSGAPYMQRVTVSVLHSVCSQGQHCNQNFL